MANPKALGPRPSTHIRDGVAAVSTGVAGWAITPMLGYPGWAAPTLACGVLTGLGVITHGQISARRAEILNYLNKTLAPALGVSSPRGRRLVKAKGWTLSWPGHPRRVVLRYGTGRLKAADDQEEQQAPGPKTPVKVLDIGEPRWANEVARQVSTRLGADYDVDSNDPVKGRLALNLRTKPRETPTPEPLQVTRSKKLVNELLANTATITKVVTDETTGDVRRLEVNHQVGAKLAAAGYQRRVERTVSVMLPGRWRAKWDLEGDSVVFEVRPSLPDSLWIPPLEIPDTDPLKNYRSVKIPYGVDEDGETIFWSPAITPQWLITGQTGSGKRLPLSTPIPTPTGWTTMGELVEGDTILGRDGKPCRVETLWAVEEQPDLYQITFSDGQTILADAEHQWLVSSRHDRVSVNHPKRLSAVENHHRALQLVDHLDQLAFEAPAREVRLREILDYLDLHAPDVPWSTQLGVRAALEAVDCPFQIAARRIPRRGTNGFIRPVRLYQLPVALKALATRLAEQHHTPPSTEVAEVRMTTAEMLAGGVRIGISDHANFAVRVTQPLELPEADLPIDPYVLGAWLGDGTSSNGGFTGIDPEILHEIQKAGFDTHSHAHIAKAHYIRGLMPHLRAIDVLGNKHIPLSYLRSSMAQRLALLQGLMDTDGTVDAAGCCELALSDPRLAEDALDLIRSMGIKASMTKAGASYRGTDGELVDCRDRYRIHFTTTTPVFRLERKVARLPEATRSTQDWLYITSIEKAPAEPARCITVDSPDRTYLCGSGYVPTSNTSTAHGILTQITQFGWPVWVADGKGIEFLGFQDWPNVQIVASRIEEQIAVIHRAWQLMQTRYDLVVQRRARTEDFEPLVVFIDEFSDLKANLTNWYSQIKVKGEPTKPPTLAEVGSIARKGRTARVHMVVSMQRPDQDFFAGVGGDTRDNFGMRTSMGPLSPQGAEMMWGNQVTGVALPRGKVGRAIGINKNGLPVEMQAYRVPDPKDSVEGTEEYELLQKLRPAESGHERLVIVPPEIDWEAEEPVELRFNDYAEAEWAKASERPDLDPLTWEQDAALHDGRSLSSAMALFGLDGEKPLGPGVRSIAAAGSSGGDAPEDGSTSSGYEADDIYVEGYDQPVSVLVSTLAPGHLVCVDSEIDAWAVVEEEPVEDISDPESLVIAWRDDQDNSGELSLPVGSFVQARRPSELAMA